MLVYAEDSFFDQFQCHNYFSVHVEVLVNSSVFPCAGDSSVESTL